MNAIVMVFMVTFIMSMIPDAIAFQELEQSVQAATVTFTLLVSGAGVIVLLFNPTAFGVYELAWRASSEGSATLKTFFKGIATHAARALVILFVNLAVYALFAVAVYTYLFRLPSALSDFGVIFVSLAVVFYFFLFITNFYAIPLMTAERIGFFKSIRRAALLMMDNILPTLWMTFMILAIVLLSLALFLIPFIFIGISAAALFMFATYVSVMEKYGDTLRANERDDRSLRKFWKPWEQ